MSTTCHGCTGPTILKCSRCRTPLCSLACSVTAKHVLQHRLLCIADNDNDNMEEDSSSDYVIDRAEYLNIAVDVQQMSKGMTIYQIKAQLKPDVVNLSEEMRAFYEEYRGRDILDIVLSYTPALYRPQQGIGLIDLGFYSSIYYYPGQRTPASFGDSVRQFAKYLASVVLCSVLEEPNAPWQRNDEFNVEAFNLRTNRQEDMKRWQREQNGLLQYYKQAFGLAPRSTERAAQNTAQGEGTTLYGTVGTVLDFCKQFTSEIDWEDY